MNCQSQCLVLLNSTVALRRGRILFLMNGDCVNDEDEVSSFAPSMTVPGRL